MAGPGGARPGAGRKPNSVNRLSREAVEKAKEGGLMPLDYLLDIMRDEANERDLRMDAAKAAAPYVHPKLSAIEANVTAQVSLGDMLDALDG